LERLTQEDSVKKTWPEGLHQEGRKTHSERLQSGRLVQSGRLKAKRLKQEDSARNT
jgi:hypothetical protein